MTAPSIPPRKEIIPIPGSNYSGIITRDTSHSSSSSSSASAFSSPKLRVDLRGLKLDGKSMELSATQHGTTFSFSSIQRESGPMSQSVSTVSKPSSSGTTSKTDTTVRTRLESTIPPSKPTDLVFGHKPYAVKISKVDDDDDGDGVRISFGTDPNLSVSYEEGTILITYFEHKYTISPSLGNYTIVGKPPTQEVLVRFPNGTKQVFRPSTES